MVAQSELEQNPSDVLFCHALRALHRFPGWYELLLNASIGDREYYVLDTPDQLNAAFKLQSLGFVYYSRLFEGVLTTPNGKAFLVWLDVNEVVK